MESVLILRWKSNSKYADVAILEASNFVHKTSHTSVIKKAKNPGDEVKREIFRFM